MTSGQLGAVNGLWFGIVAFLSKEVLQWAGTSGWFTAAGMVVITGAVVWVTHLTTGTQTAAGFAAHQG